MQHPESNAGPGASGMTPSVAARQSDTTATQPWYRALNRQQWNALFASNLGWLFDGYETYALILTVGIALRQLLDTSLSAQIPWYAGLVIALTVLGWGIGGLIGGVLADYIGRKRTMLFAILAYSLTTGLSAFAWSWESFAILRFVVGLAMGSEWATGTAMTAELWPDEHRGKGAGLMQCGLGIGFFVASLVWLFVSETGDHAWRYMYLIGVLPGFVTLWMRSGIPESEQWEHVNRERRKTRALKREGGVLTEHQQALTRFTLVDLFASPALRRRTLFAVLMCLATTLGWYGISSWVPPYIGSVAAHSGLSAARYAGFAGMTYNLGAITGYIVFGFCADAIGRKRMTLLFFCMTFIITPVLFKLTHRVDILLVVAGVSGFFSLGQFAWMPTWLPELYPTRVRATAIAFCFNVPRFLAWTGPLVAGTLIAHFGDYGRAAMIVNAVYVLGIVLSPLLPETRGKPLPEDV
ncbi:MFS transporter [Paraburkholderia susongensis]|uniref:Sugar transporter n=1 Tax=Paraburkholderia susongensis TaxID=1515439 RepID=A0A1X7M3D9_9BURK|nr:MFS transporter [Paraburkholderia susongensis]SMG60706.1 Sugar transporter [Paraburkholderia susongensis]